MLAESKKKIFSAALPFYGKGCRHNFNPGAASVFYSNEPEALFTAWKLELPQLSHVQMFVVVVINKMLLM